VVVLFENLIGFSGLRRSRVQGLSLGLDIGPKLLDLRPKVFGSHVIHSFDKVARIGDDEVWRQRFAAARVGDGEVRRQRYAAAWIGDDEARLVGSLDRQDPKVVG
jgi:hypothetical protein